MSSLVVEVMTSLSNVYRLTENQVNSGKVIQVKPVKSVQPTQPEHTQEDKVETLQRESEELFNQAKDELEQAKAEAERLIQEANNKIEKEYEALEQQSKETLEQSKAQGYQEGFQQGKEEAEQQYDVVLNEMQQLTGAIKDQYQQKLKDAEFDILQIALASAEKIIQQQLTDDSTKFLNIVKHSLEEVVDQPEVVLNINPEDYSQVHQYRQELEQLFPDKSILTIYPNKEITKFGCRIESPFGMIDSSLDSQLEQLKQHLTDLIKGEKPFGSEEDH
ncbi:flagellar assembly protein FliH [Tenuibacillus multivorans]|uniref:Flagellar assembly protein FliH n=1 Tax=Tenuibacillus multivorans TaxID=237069 RepID=A0A1G9XZX6_9BACI|nr:flagellar assembly protein FliH [Tenuibacillus multivorans]